MIAKKPRASFRKSGARPTRTTQSRNHDADDETQESEIDEDQIVKVCSLSANWNVSGKSFPGNSDLLIQK